MSFKLCGMSTNQIPTIMVQTKQKKRKKAKEKCASDYQVWVVPCPSFTNRFVWLLLMRAFFIYQTNLW